jgi:hypothetical protein
MTESTSAPDDNATQPENSGAAGQPSAASQQVASGAATSTQANSGSGQSGPVANANELSLWIINGLLILVILVIFNLWVTFRADPNVGIVSSITTGIALAVFGFIWWLYNRTKTKEEKARNVIGRAFRSKRTRFALVAVVVIFLALISSIGTLELKPIHNVDRITVVRADSGAEKTYDLPNDGKSRRQRWRNPFCPTRRLIVKATGYPDRSFSLGSWQKQTIDQGFFWEQPVLVLLLSNRAALAIGNDNIIAISLTIDGKPLGNPIQFSGAVRGSIILGPVDDDVRLPDRTIREWERDYATTDVNRWRSGGFRKVRRIELKPGAKVNVEVRYAGLSDTIPVRLNDDSPIGAGRWSRSYPQWKIIDVAK